MLLSPPFFVQRNATETDEQFVRRSMAAGTAGDGGFPVSVDMNWHGGVHLTAPGGGSSAAVRAIADGTVKFVRKPTKRSTDPKHPLNYRGGWTDDGCVVVQHDTAIGFDSAANSETTVTFFSAYMHLGAVGALSVNDTVFRKDVLGGAGSIYGTGQRFHLEVVCDDANIQKLTGRTTGFTSTSSDGRADVVYGTLWFFCKIGTSFFATEPQSGKPQPAVVFTNDQEALWISMRYSGGDAEFATFHLDGQPLGASLKAAGFAYHLVANARRRYPNSPDAGVELLRFGRVLGQNALNPATAPNFQRVPLASGTGFVDLHAAGMLCFSDADFPSWDRGFKSGWKLIDGSSSQDSRCNDTTVVEALDVDGDLVVKPEEAASRLNDPTTQAALARKICKFPSEWDPSTIDARFSWLKTDKRVKMSDADFTTFRAHVQALCFWQGTQPGIASNHWHFHPVEFVRHFRQCLWLSKREMTQCVPRKVAHLSGTTWQTLNSSSFAAAQQRVGPWSVTLNGMMRRYGIAETPLRIAHFFAQVFDETGSLRHVKEIGGEHAKYAPYYGRGMIQLTHEAGYRNYGQYRRFPQLHPSNNPTFSAIGWDPDVLIALNDTTFDRENAADTGGFYWVSPSNNNGNQRADGGSALANIVSESKFINGNFPNEIVNGLDGRISNFLNLKYQLLDDLRPASNTETVTFVWRRNSAKEPVLLPSGAPQLDAKGNPVTKFFPATHTVTFPLDPQRP